LTTLSFAQTRTITGRVTDERGEPVAFASIKLKGSRSGIAADAAGNFSINAKSGDVLVISGTGLIEKEVTVGEDNILNIPLQRSQSALTEVFVTGYNTKSKRSSPGSATSVTIDDIRTQPMASFDQLLQGQAPGINVVTGSGQPGRAADVTIRGRGSISGSTQPLYIVDGVEINAQDFSTLNQGDFESVTVLKDAAAASIYGSRAAGGVIVITTRRGRVGPTRFSYDVQYGQSKWPRSKLKLMNSNEKLDYELENGNPNGWTPAEIDSLRNIETDWEKVFFRTGITQQHQLSASGGNDKTRFYASIAYLNQTGVVRASALKRYTGRLNVETGTENLRVGINSTFGYSIFNSTQENNQSIGSPLNGIRWSLPYFTPYDAEGNYLKDPTPSQQPNPLEELLENKRRFPQWKAIGNVFAEYKLPFFTEVTLRTNWGMDYTQNETEIYLKRTTAAGGNATGGQGSLARAFNRNLRFVGTNSINYKKTFNGEHDLNATVYQEYLHEDFRAFNFTGYGLTLPFPNESAITSGTTTNGFIPVVGGTGTENSLVSYFGEVDYGFRNRYFLHAGYRRDGSSKFGANNRWADFYNVGASWIISDESFMESWGKLDMLKLKASYGTVGNQDGIADFASRAQLTRSGYGGTTGLRLTDAGNPNLRWETRATFNAGIEFGILKNRIGGSVEYYNSTTTDLFYRRAVSGTSGFATVLANAGKLRNEGIEVSLRAQPVKTSAFSWDIEGNFTYNKNRILELGPDGEDNVQNGVTVLKIGKPLNTIWLVKYAGVDPDNGDPLYFDKDGKVTNVYDPADNAYLGTSDAPYFGGINNTFNFKGLELQVFWVYALGNEVYNNDRLNVENPGYTASQLSKDLLREWRNPGDVTDIPRADPSVYFLDGTTRFVENGSYWRLRNVQLSYNLPRSVVQKIRVNNVRVFVQGQNLVTITEYRGYDPEVPGGGSLNAGAQYPTLKTITAGINIGF
ncbi:MAG TPA: TonB-dependent receptor, partial [Chitinophagaceae bacterium]